MQPGMDGRQLVFQRSHSLLGNAAQETAGAGNIKPTLMRADAANQKSLTSNRAPSLSIYNYPAGNPTATRVKMDCDVERKDGMSPR